ncbi:hypothetical protein SAMN03159423_4300 [Bradyrhizobium sp. NFR13]|uniref:hypothetical protein n=1 Tax=Bradyrhizobium sp. NFR13 TaxID=1566285 RepID=UPI0008EE9ABE|nr:hypothetical protein [Bradyrhizobium sp. NFR13]SFL90277.1 hypothetical protein SAMN03159423_4300 [Bradyrhizobium sp. NFR13]
MTSLPSKLESFIETMKKGDEFAHHGFELLSKRSEPEKYFDALKNAGFFNADRNPEAIPSQEPGFVQIPFWSALVYLKAVSKSAGENDNSRLADKILAVVRGVTTFRGANGKYRDNYRTYYSFADMFGVLPLASISLDDIALVRIWLASRFDRSLVASSLSKGLLKRLLSAALPENIDRACELLKECVAFEWRSEKDQRGRELVSAVDDYWLKELLDAHARTIGGKAGLRAVRIFEEGLRTIFSDVRRSYGSTLWRPAIETSEQNTEFGSVENRFVEGMRESLGGWIEAAPSDAVGYVKEILTDKSDIIRRIAVNSVIEYFELLSETFEEVISKELFSVELRHEMYRLLKQRFSRLSAVGKEKVIASLRDLPQLAVEDSERRLRFTQREWLTAIKDQPEVTDWYHELLADTTLGAPSDHPEFLSYHETRMGPGPAPFEQEAIVAFAEDGSLVGRLNAFEETDSWKGPTLRGLIDALEAAVASAPGAFISLLAEFNQAKIPFQYALISGFLRAFEMVDEKRELFDWNLAWPRLISFFADRLNDPDFWLESTGDEQGGMIANRSWLTSLISRLLEAGTKNDATAYSPELLPQAWELIKVLLDRSEAEPANLADPMMRALNNEKGHAVGAMYNHALRCCRLAQHKGEKVSEAWDVLAPVFDLELAKCRDANFEFSTLSASYIANLEYMSEPWLTANIHGLFPQDYVANFKAAVGGLPYATPTRRIYQLLASTSVIDHALQLQLENSHSRERLIEWICLAYLWGDEELESREMSRIFKGEAADVTDAVDFFWQVRGDKLTPVQVERVLAFWERTLSWASKQPEVPEVVLSHASRLAPYLATLDERGASLLRTVMPYVHSDYSTDQMIEELARLAESNPATAVELLELMFQSHTPNFDLDNKLKTLLETLHTAGYRQEVLRIVEKLRKTLPDMLSFYIKLRDNSQNSP